MLHVCTSQGSITLIDAIDREPYMKRYPLHVDVLDSGLPRRTNAALITILNPANRKPVIDESSTTMTALESIPIGTVIGKIEARDPDDDEESNQLKYYMDVNNNGKKLV